jgi:hypothetical protein
MYKSDVLEGVDLVFPGDECLQGGDLSKRLNRRDVVVGDVENLQLPIVLEWLQRCDMVVGNIQFAKIDEFLNERVKREDLGGLEEYRSDTDGV